MSAEVPKAFTASHKLVCSRCKNKRRLKKEELKQNQSGARVHMAVKANDTVLLKHLC